MKKCPNCDIVMNEVLKIDVVIDVCPSCMGVWLDKGELDKIIARGKQEDNSSAPYKGESYDDYSQHEKYGNDRRNYPRKKKGGIAEIFGDLFD